MNAGPFRQQIAGLTVLYKQGKLQETLLQAEALAKQFPNEPITANLLGAVYVDLGHLEQAAASYSRALQIKPDFAEAHNNLGDVLKSLGRLDEAVASYGRALQIKSDFVVALNNLGAALNDLGKPDEAEASCNKALQIDPAFAKAHRFLSTVKKYQDSDPQIHQMLKLIERNNLPDEDRIHLNFALAKAHEDVGDYDKAFSYYVECNCLHKEE